MTTTLPTGLIAEDEPLLRDALERLLGEVWPELVIVARARNGREAVRLFESQRPDVCFLDVQMPGMTGVEAAQQIGRRAHLVFVTAFDHYAVQAFEHGVLDYLVKPVDRKRLADTVRRLQGRVLQSAPAANTESLLTELLARLTRPQELRWIKASVGQTVTVIAVVDIDFLRAEDKYTVVSWREQDGKAHEALIRTPLKELLAQLDPAVFVQVHRSVVVNLSRIAEVIRADNDTAQIRLKGRSDVLPVSRSFLHVFRHM